MVNPFWMFKEIFVGHLKLPTSNCVSLIMIIITRYAKASKGNNFQLYVLKKIVNFFVIAKYPEVLKEKVKNGTWLLKFQLQVAHHLALTNGLCPLDPTMAFTTLEFKHNLFLI